MNEFEKEDEYYKDEMDMYKCKKRKKLLVGFSLT